ncbi:MAG: hypothetical protein WC551_11710 [Patescibacteria group bacterium]
MSALLRKYAESRDLPEGHVGRRQAEEALNREYQRCSEIERFWRKRMQPPCDYFKDSEVALQFVNSICVGLGERPVKAVNFKNPLLPDASAWYNRTDKTINTSHTWIHWTTLVHELTHHFKECFAHGHGEVYCTTLNTVYSLVYEMWTGKQSNPDWETKAMQTPLKHLR